MIDPAEITESIEDQKDAGGAIPPADPPPTVNGAGGEGDLPRLTLEAIVAADDLGEDTIDVPEWGGSLRVRAMTKQRQLEIREESASGNDRNLAELLMFTACVIEPEMTSAAVSVLRGKSAAVFDRVMRRILELNGAEPGAREAAKRRFPGRE
jgi:hypothetical protein